MILERSIVLVLVDDLESERRRRCCLMSALGAARSAHAVSQAQHDRLGQQSECSARDRLIGLKHRRAAELCQFLLRVERIGE